MSHIGSAVSSDSKTLWVGDVESWMDEAYIASLFAGTGAIQNVKVIRDRNTGLPAGYAFADFISHEAAKQVLLTYNGKPIPGTNKSFRLNWGVHGGGSKSTNTSTIVSSATQSATLAARSLMATPTGSDFSIYVGDLDPSVTDTDLMQFFHNRYRTVVGAKIIVDAVTKASKGYGFVKFSNFEDSQRAINEMQGVIFKGRPLKTSQSFTKNSTSDASLLGLGTSMLYNPLLAMYSAYMMNPSAQTGLYDPSLLMASSLGTMGSSALGYQDMSQLNNLTGAQSLQGASAYGYGYGYDAQQQNPYAQYGQTQAYGGGFDYSSLYSQSAYAGQYAQTTPSTTASTTPANIYGAQYGYNAYSNTQQPQAVQQSYSTPTQDQNYGHFSLSQFPVNQTVPNYQMTNITPQQTITTQPQVQQIQPQVQQVQQQVQPQNQQVQQPTKEQNLNMQNHVPESQNLAKQRDEEKQPENEEPFGVAPNYLLNKFRGDFLMKMSM